MYQFKIRANASAVLRLLVASDTSAFRYYAVLLDLGLFSLDIRGYIMALRLILVQD